MTHRIVHLGCGLILALGLSTPPLAARIDCKKKALDLAPLAGREVGLVFIVTPSRAKASPARADVLRAPLERALVAALAARGIKTTRLPDLPGMPATNAQYAAFASDTALVARLAERGLEHGILAVFDVDFARTVAVEEVRDQLTITHAATQTYGFVKALDRNGTLVGRDCFGSEHTDAGERLPNGRYKPDPVDVYVAQVAAEMVDHLLGASEAGKP